MAEEKMEHDNEPSSPTADRYMSLQTNKTDFFCCTNSHKIGIIASIHLLFTEIKLVWYRMSSIAIFMAHISKSVFFLNSLLHQTFVVVSYYLIKFKQSSSLSNMTRKAWKNSRAAKALRKQIIDNGYIQNGAPKPNEVYRSNRLYQDFKLDNFRSNYNRMLKNLKEEQEANGYINDLNGINGETASFLILFLYFLFIFKHLNSLYLFLMIDLSIDGAEGEDEELDNFQDARSAQYGSPSPSGLSKATAFAVRNVMGRGKKPAGGGTRPSAVAFNEAATFIDAGDDGGRDDATLRVTGSGGSGGGLIPENAIDITFMQNQKILLPHILAHWKDQELQDRCSLFIWQLSGLTPEDISARVMKGGETLQIRFLWPKPLQNALELTQGLYCGDSSKVVEIESIVKKLKLGSSSSMVSSTIEFDLGMQVEEQLHNETFINRGVSELEKGNKMIRFFKVIMNRRTGQKEKLPIIVQKFEMMGIRDNYRNDSTTEMEFDDADGYVIVNRPGAVSSCGHQFHTSSSSTSRINPGHSSPAKKRRHDPNLFVDTTRREDYAPGEKQQQVNNHHTEPQKVAAASMPSLSSQTNNQSAVAVIDHRDAANGKTPDLSMRRTAPSSSSASYRAVNAALNYITTGSIYNNAIKPVDEHYRSPVVENDDDEDDDMDDEFL